MVYYSHKTAKVQNLNTNNSQKYINDFNTVLNIYINDYPHDDLIELVKNGSIAEKQAAILKLDKINSKSEAEIIMNNLTGCDGKIREAVSFRLKEFVCENPDFYEDFEDIFLDAVIDINGNICRNVISAISYLKNNNKFCSNFCTKLIKNTNAIIKTVKNFDIQEGKYKTNKEIFKLYWSLETIYEFAQLIDIDVLTQTLSDTKNINDYTIREKTAKILSKIDKTEKLMQIKMELKNDDNYYVRRL